MPDSTLFGLFGIGISYQFSEFIYSIGLLEN